MAVLQVYGLLWFTGIVFVPHITAGLLSDYKICGDSECESLMSRVQAIRDHHGEDCRFLSFRQGDNIFVYHKLTGRRDDLWAGTIDKQFGYFPKDAVQEEQVYATAEKVVETQRSDFFCMDELGHPVDFSDLDSGHEIEDQKIQTQETQLNPTIPDTEDTHAESHTSFHVSARHTDGTALEGDETENIGEGAAGSHMEAQSNPVALNEQGGSPSSSWLTSPVTGWLGLGREDKSVSLPEAETDNERQETKVETLTSSVSGWLGFGGEEKDNDAVKSEADGADSFTSSMTGWLGLSGEAEIDSPKTEQNTKSEIKEENIVKFNSRRMSLDLEDSQSREEEEKEDMPTLDWLGITLSHTLGFGATSQESQPETRAEETIKEEREQSASSSWLGIGNILGYRKDESEVDDGTGGDFKDKVLEQEVIENENIKTSQMQSDEEKVEIKAQEQEQELEMESSESQDTGSNSISSSSKQDNNKEHVKEQCHVPQPETKAGFTTLALAEDIRNNNMKASDGRKNDAASIVDQKHMSPQDTLEGGEEYDEHQVSKSIENNSSRESDEDITASNADLNVLTQSDISSGTGLFSVNLNSHTTTDKVDKEVNSSDQDEEGGEITPVEIGIGGDDHDNDGRTRETDPYVDVTLSSVKSIEAQESVSPETEQRVAEDDDGVDKLKGSEQNVQNNQIVSAESGLMEAMRSAAEMEAEENETMEEKQNGEQDELNKVEKVQEEGKKLVIVEETLAETSDVAEEKKKQGVNERQEREKQEDVVEFQEELNEVEEIKEEDKRKTGSVDETYVEEKQRENEESREMELEGETDQETVQVDKEIQGGEKQRGLVELQDEEKREHLGDVNKVQGMMEVQDERDIKEWEKHEEVDDLKQELQNMEETRQEVVEEGGNVEEGKEEQKQQEDEKEKLHKMEEIREGEKQERVEELKEVEELIDKETMQEVKETREEKQQEELVEAKDEEKREHLGEANKVQGRMEVQDERDIKEWEKHEEVDDLKQELQNMEETRQEVVEEGGNVEEGKEEQKQQEADILKEKEKLQKMEEVREGEKQERVEELKEVEELIDKETMQEVKETREEKQQEELVEAKDEEKREPIERVNKEDEIKREEMQEEMLMKENERVEEIRELKKDEEKQEEVREFQEENRQESEEKEIRPEKREQVEVEVKEEMLEDGVGLEVGEKQERGEASIENEKQKEVMEVQEEGEKEEVVAFGQEIKEAEKQEESEQRQVEEGEKQKEKDELKGDSEVVEEAKDEKKPPEVKGLKEEMEEFNEERRMLNNENNHGEGEEEWRKMEEIKERERQGDMEELGVKEKSDMEQVKEEETHEDVEDLKTEEKRVEEVKEEEKQVKEELMKKENEDEEVKEEEAPDKVEGSKEEEKQTEIKEFQEDKQYKVEEVHKKHKQQEVKEIQEGNQEDEELKEEMRQEGLKEVKKREEILENEKIGEVEELKGGQGENLEELKVKEKVEVNEFKLREEEVEQDDKRDEEEEQSVSDGKTSVDESRLTDEEKIHNHHTGQLQTKEGSFNIIQTEYVGLPHPHEILHRQAAENKEYGGLQPSEAKQSDLSADTVLNTEHDDSEAGRNETETEQILSQVNDQAVICDQTAPHVSKDPTGSSLMSDDGNTRTAETEDGGSFGLFKNVFGFYSQTPVTKTSDSGSGLTADETSQPQASLSSEQDIEQASPVAPSPGEPQYSSSSADILTSSPSNSHTPSQHIESSRQTKTLPKSYKFLLAYMSVDEVSSLIEPFGPYKLQFLDFMLGSSAAATEDESILSDIERQLHYHRETLSTPAMRQDDAPREDEEKTCTLVALQKLEMLITRVRETSRAKKSDTRGNDQAEVSCVSGSCSTNSKDGEMSTAGHSIKTEDPSIAQDNNIQRDENTVEENRGQRCTGEMKSAHDKRPDLEGGCEEKSVHFADHPHNQSGSPQTREGALEVILNTVHHIAQESVSRVNAVREFLIWTAQVRLLFA